METAIGKLLSHPYWKSLFPEYRRLLHLSAPLPTGLNPYTEEGVVIQLALAHGEMRSIKEVVARNIILGKIRSGELYPGATAIDATSGNTGRAYAGILQPLGINLRLIVQGTLPAGKLGQLRIYGEGVELVPHFGPESTVQRARREAEESGGKLVLLDQYSCEANPQAHEQYTAPELLGLTGGVVDAIVTPLGTCGTAIGFSRFFKKWGKKTNREIKIVGVACDHNQKVPQIPGMRTIPEIDRDVRLQWRDDVDQIRLVLREHAVRGSRRLAYAEQSWPGLSTGAAYIGAIEHIGENLEWFRDKRVIIISPDSIEPYMDIMNAEQDDASVARALSARPEF
ncbi:MAG: pyridoxal-phosphate dependent enzyme [bacterium]|nr:pyridoxal-phosphate dependent enzyme [bacterium]